MVDRARLRTCEWPGCRAAAVRHVTVHLVDEGGRPQGRAHFDWCDEHGESATRRLDRLAGEGRGPTCSTRACTGQVAASVPVVDQAGVERRYPFCERCAGELARATGVPAALWLA